MKKKINEEMKQILLGSLLGDGSISLKGTPWYCEVHSIKQKDYLLWKNDTCFRALGSKLYTYKQYEKMQQKHYEKISVHIRSPELSPYYELLYPSGKKRVNRRILDQLNGLGLAVWYCDDGSYHITKKIVRIMTDSFSYAEQEEIKEWFKEKWNLVCGITKRKSGSFHIIFNVKESEKFLNLIKGYVHESMLYKLGHLWEGNDERIEGALKREALQKKKYYLKNREKITARQKKYLENPYIKKKIKLNKQKYYEINRERIIARYNSYRERNAERIKEQKQEYYKRNKLKIKENQRKYYLKHRDKILIKQTAYNKKPENKERKRIYDKKYSLRKKGD